MDRHLNLFYTYATNHLEDNVTRAFILTLQRMSAAHARVYLRHLLRPRHTSEGRPTHKCRIAGKIDPGAEDGGLEFGLQPTFRAPDGQGSESDRDDEGEALTAENGAVVAITTESRSLSFDEESMLEAEQMGRPDAIFRDPANEVTIIFESKLSGASVSNQVSKYYHMAFDVDASVQEDVCLHLTWNDVVESFEWVRSLGTSEIENHFIDHFIEYLDLLRLVEFRGFREHDFERGETRQLSRFLGLVLDSLKEDLQLGEYEGGQRVDLKTVPKENLWITLKPDSLNIGIVCGAGNKPKSHSQQFFRHLKENRDGLRAILEALDHDLKAVVPSIRLQIALNGRFYKSQYRKQYLWAVGGHKAFPSQYDEFVNEFTNERRNTFERLDRPKINELFEEEIKQLRSRRDDVQQFPTWPDVQDNILQHYYFDIEVVIPKNELINPGIKDVQALFGSVLHAIKPAMEAIDEAVH